jgi:hypothetical protein
MKQPINERRASNRREPVGGLPAPLVGLEFDAQRAERV